MTINVFSVYGKNTYFLYQKLDFSFLLKSNMKNVVNCTSYDCCVFETQKVAQLRILADLLVHGRIIPEQNSKSY